jgi:hypothetical protein
LESNGEKMRLGILRGVITIDMTRKGYQSWT